VTILGTAVWAWVLLDRAADWLPWLKVVVAVVSLVAAVLVVLPPRGRMLAVATIATTLVGALIAPAAYSLQTVTTGHSGSIVTAGPTVSGSMGGPGGGGGFRGGAQGAPGGTAPGGTPPGATAQGGTGAAQGGTRGGAGGLLGSSSVSSSLTALLTTNASTYTWVAAAVGSNSAAGYQLATQQAVMPIGGFNGSDPSPTLAQFKAYVAAGEIHYFIAGGVGQSNGGSNASSQIESWVEQNFTAKTVGGVTVYDLTAE
jgi:hypothetical protein